MTVSGFRKLALAFPETVEAAHMGHPDFRVRGKIFSTLLPDQSLGMVKLTPAQQAQFVKTEPAVFAPVKGGWGRRGATQVHLKSAKAAAVHGALVAAWLNNAPKDLIAQYESRD